MLHASTLQIHDAHAMNYDTSTVHTLYTHTHTHTHRGPAPARSPARLPGRGAVDKLRNAEHPPAGGRTPTQTHTRLDGWLEPQSKCPPAPCASSLPADTAVHTPRRDTLGTRSHAHILPRSYRAPLLQAGRRAVGTKAGRRAVAQWQAGVGVLPAPLPESACDVGPF